MISKRMVILPELQWYLRQPKESPKMGSRSISAPRVGKSKTELRKESSKEFNREVLHGVGADGVVKFPIFAVKCSRLPLSSRRIREKRRKKKPRKSEETRRKRKKCVKRGKFL